MESVMYSLSAISKYFSAHRLGVTLLIVNVIGTMVYEYAVSPSWAIPEERAAGIYSVTGEGVVWVSRALPILIGFGLLNLPWGACICIGKKWQSGYLWLATAVIWLIALWVDFAHH
jgi:hypothetical protein